MLGIIGRFAREARQPAMAAAAVAIMLPALAVPSLARGPEAIADVAEQVIDAVVNISTSQNVGARSGQQQPQAPNDPQLDELFRDFFNRRGQQGENPPRGPRRVSSLGSGFIIDSGGIVVTNNHVISEADEITVILNDGSRLKAELIGKDQKTDIAVIKIDAGQDLPTVTLGDSDRLEVGEWVMAIGNPFGLDHTVTSGIVSAKGRQIGAGPYDNFIQTDASINPGNSGGPLINLRGEVVGITTAIYSQSGGNIGIGFAIPAEMVKRVVDAAVHGGSLVRPWLGAKGVTIDGTKAAALGLDRPRGVLISAVYAGGPADKAGLKEGDVVLTVDGREVFDDRGMRANRSE